MAEGPPRAPDERHAAWEASFAPPEPTADIASYLRTYGARYTREALDSRLVAAGHQPDAIAAAWAAVDAEDAAAGRRDRRRQTAAIIGWAYLVTWVLVVLLVILPKGDAQYSPALLLAAILAVFLFVPGIIAVLIARGTGWLRRASVGRVIAFAFVPMVILFALAGTCVAYVRSY